VGGTGRLSNNTAAVGCELQWYVQVVGPRPLVWCYRTCPTARVYQLAACSCGMSLRGADTAGDSVQTYTLYKSFCMCRSYSCEWDCGFVLSWCLPALSALCLRSKSGRGCSSNLSEGQRISTKSGLQCGHTSHCLGVRLRAVCSSATCKPCAIIEWRPYFWSCGINTSVGDSRRYY
jgi:hypothetical protein